MAVASKRIAGWLRQNALLVGIITGAVTGGVLGWLAPEVAISVGFAGDLFLVLLRMLVVPLVVASMITGVASLGDVRRLGRTGATTLAYYATTTALALITGLVMVNLMQPGVGMDIGSARELPAEIAAKGTIGWRDMLERLITPNLFKAAAETEILPLIVFSLAFGAALTTLGESGKRVLDVFEGMNAAIMKLVHVVMWTAPVGVLGLVAGRLGREGGGEGLIRVLSGLGVYALTVVIGLLVHAFVTLSLILFLVGRRNPLHYARGIGTALLSAFATASSSATLPITMENLEKNNHVSARATRFVLPLGATVNMDGTAMYEAVAAVFIAQAWGIELDFGKQLIIFVTATLASIGAAGIPEAGTVTMVIVLNAVGLPLEGIGLILAIDWLLDRCRTTVNVWGDAVGAAVVERLQETTGPDAPPAEIASG